MRNQWEPVKKHWLFWCGYVTMNHTIRYRVYQKRVYIIVDSGQEKSSEGQKGCDFMKDKILLFHMTEEEVLAKIQMACLMGRLGAKVIDKKDYLQTVGYLAGVAGMESKEIVYDGPEMEEPMMILCMSSARIDQVLAAFRQLGVPRIAYKAMLTPTNSTWTPLALYEELKREHEEFQKRSGK